MFKIESYVTPILLSYVDKYVRDFKPADAQVSLWGGGVLLHNLVLKADVLQNELALPFTLVSGRIHELLIQVPWTKIMSEPIIVTIDTIECVLSLNPPAGPEENAQPESLSRKTQVVETPPGYMQALVRRIVSNITLRVHHLIVKYVQDDIVLSLNVKHLAVDSAGNSWEPAFADIDQNEPVIRRLVKLDDLTLCLDRSDSDGKIRFYQEPLLYRCQLDLRVLTRLVSANTRRASSLNIQLHSSKLAWGVTNDQLVLLLRLIRERFAVMRKTSPPAPKINASQIASMHSLSNTAEPARSESWSEWAWSWMPTWSDREDGAEEAPMPPTPTPVYFSAYLDEVSLVFKVMEIEGGGRKRSRSVLEFSASYAAAKSAMWAPTSMVVKVGTRALTIRSQGKCVCGHVDINAINEEPTIYLEKIERTNSEDWEWPEDYLDDQNIEVAVAAEEENRDQEVKHEDSEPRTTDGGQPEEPVPVQKEPSDVVDDLWLKMSPLVYLEYKHQRFPSSPSVNPYENPPIDFQYSDWVEDCSLKIKLQPLELRICMGLLHRILTIRNIFQEIPLSLEPNPAPPMRVLTIEECESLVENLPQRLINVDVTNLRIRLFPWDHSSTERPVKSPVVLDIETPKANLIITAPLYPHRVCSAACQMPDATGPIWQGARLNISASVTALQAKICSPSNEQPKPCVRAELRFVVHVLLHQEFFSKEDTVMFSYSIRLREGNVSGSAARLQAAWELISSLLSEKMSLHLRHTTLARDALNDEELVAIDITLEDLYSRGYITKNVNTHIVSMQAARATALHSPNPETLQQAWLFSGPDVPTTTPYLRTAVQWCNENLPNSLDFVGVWTEPTAICVDPLFIAWLAYKPNLKTIVEYPLTTASRTISSTQYFMRRRNTPPSSSGRGGSRSGSVTDMVHVPHRSIESSSEPSEKKEQPKQMQPVKPPQQWWKGDRLLQLHNRLRHMLITMELGLVLVYVTMSTASAVDCATVRLAMERHAAAAQRVLSLSVGRWSLHSSSITKHLWHDIRHDGPTYLDAKVNEKVESFPWKMRLADVSCYTLESRAGTEKLGREKTSSGLRSQLKSTHVVQPRTVLELVTSTVILSVVTKTMHVKTATRKQEHRKHTEPSKDGGKMKYFTTGEDFKPSSLKEFVRGPARRKKSAADQEPVINEPASPNDKEAHGPMVSLGVNLHADTPPIIFRINQDQVHMVAAALHCYRHIIALLKRAPLIVPRQGYTSLGGSNRSLIRSVSELDEERSNTGSTHSETRSELIPIFEAHPDIEQKEMKTFFWFQWVVSRATVVVTSYLVKLVFDIDDIISTIDLQEHYNQLKIKVASASVKHYERQGSNEWTAGVLGGRVLEVREPTNAKEDNHFLSVTITQAQISTLPASWKEELHPKLLEQKSSADSMWEIYATLAPLEVLLQPTVLENIIFVAKELAPRSFCPLQAERSTSTWQWPFCYIVAGGLRLILTCEETRDLVDDTFVFMFGRMTVNPHPENPICRRPINTCAEPAWLSVAGGFEGRQYEMLVKNIAIRTALFSQLVYQEETESDLLKAVGSENPARKWSQPVVSPVITPVLHTVDVGCVLAPALYIGGVLACGVGVEVNLMSDCAFELSIVQLNLIRQIIDDINGPPKSVETGAMFEDETHGVCPYASLLMKSTAQEDDVSFLSENAFSEAEVSKTPSDFGRSLAEDSGVDTVTSRSTFKFGRNQDNLGSLKKSASVGFIDEKINPLEHFELFVTMGIIELSLYTADDNSPEVVALRPDALPAHPSPEAAAQDVAKENKKNANIQAAESVVTIRSLTENMRQTDIGKDKLELEVLPRARKNENNLPLIHVTLYQPNLYYWRKKSQKSLQVSLFNMWVGLGAGPDESQWNAVLLSTASGVPDPVSDIPPALATLKLTTAISGSSYASISNFSNTRGTLRLDIERPVLLEVSADRLKRLKGIFDLVMRNIPQRKLGHLQANPVKVPALYNLRRFMVKHSIENTIIQTSQVAVSGSQGAAGWDSASLQMALGARPERLVVRTLVHALLVAAGEPSDARRQVLQPLQLGLEVEATWEAWKRGEGGISAREPTLRIYFDLDCVNLELHPADLAALNMMLRILVELRGESEIPSMPSSTDSEDSLATSQKSSSHFTSVNFGQRVSGASFESLGGHYYKDDLRSGAFKIVSGGQLPMAYQVMLHKNAVSWRYPHPRAITRLVAFPLPGHDKEIECVLELYSPMLGSWEPHTYVTLPVNEPKEILHLYVGPPDSVFATMWRFRPCLNRYHKVHYEFNVKKFMPRSDPLVVDVEPECSSAWSESCVTAEELSGVLRVDSYFAPQLLPNLRLTVRLTELNVNVHNSLPSLTSQSTALEGYYVSRPLMRSHQMFSVSARGATLRGHLGSQAGTLLLLSGELSSDILDCATGTMEPLVDEFRWQAGLSLPAQALNSSRIRFYAGTIHTSLYAPRLRTLHALAADWKAAFGQIIDETSSNDNIEPVEEIKSRRELAAAAATALEGRVSLWLHNSCAFALRVGQTETDEVVPLGPAARLAYRWRSPTAVKTLRFALSNPSANWHWSNSVPFTVGTCRVRLEDAESLGSDSESLASGVFLHITVEQNGANRYMHISGRLALANMLRFGLLYKVRARFNESSVWRTVCSGELAAETVGRSVICSAKCEMLLKIGFTDHDSGWSGDIPLKECPKENVPWLVKVPSQGESPYMSVWCRVVRARSDGRILATVWPLYVLHSNLPLDTDVLIVTNKKPSAGDLTSEEAQPPAPLIQTALGRGASTHLLTHGTTSAKHSLTFQYRNIECPVTREAIPLHYGVTDTSVFDKRAPINSIEEVLQEILNWLERSGRNVTSSWPYSIVTSHWPGAWQPALMQPRCDVLVRYQAIRAGGGCSLGISLSPMVLLCNASPVALTLRAHDAAPLCKLEPGAAISPPSAVLQKPFFMSVEIGRETFVSNRLEVSSIEPGRYGKPPEGQVALDHSANFAIQCNLKVAMLTLHYEIKNEINILGLTSTFVLINSLDTDILVSAIAVPNDVAKEVTLHPKTFKVVQPTKPGSIMGTPLCRFWLRDRWRGGDASELHTLLCVTLPTDGYPASPPVPIRLGAAPVRRALGLTDVNKQSMAVVVTQQKHDGRWLINVATDPCPQFVVHNRTRMLLTVGQPMQTGDEPSVSYTMAVSECKGVRWWCTVGQGAVVHYSTPAHSARHPAAGDEPMPLPFLTFARAYEDLDPDWCPPVAVADGEQLVQLGRDMTLKLRVRTHPHSTLIELQDVDHNDISASDIRRRLVQPFSEDSILSTEEVRDEFPKNRSLDRVNAQERLIKQSLEEQENQEGDPEKRSSTSIDVDEKAVRKVNEEELELRKPEKEAEEKPKAATLTFVEAGNSQPDSAEATVECAPSVVTIAKPNLASETCSYVFPNSADLEWENPSLAETERIRGVVLTVAVEMAVDCDTRPLFALHLDRASLLIATHASSTKTTLSIADVQMDNLQFESGLYDFAVVATTRAEPLARGGWPALWNMFADRETYATQPNEARVLLKITQDKWTVVTHKFKELTEVDLKVGPLALYIEDAYVKALAELFRQAFPSAAPTDDAVTLAEAHCLQCPLRLRALNIHPLELTLTLHTAVRMYIALDQSPLHLGAFKLRNMMTSPERLVHALTVHYLSAAILGAGWVVGGLELLGAPGALAARVGGASGGVKGVASAAAAALLRSLSAWAGSLARNLDLLAGDEEHARRAAAARRRPPDSFFSGLITGMTNFAINILGAVGGLAHHPLVGVAIGETESGATALRRGLLGALTKPLSATADLVAYAGHGLLRQAGWDPVPQPRATWAQREVASAGWRRDCVRWAFRLAQLSAFAGFEVLLDSAPLQLLITHRYLVVAEPETERIVEMIDFRFCSLGSYQGSIIELIVTQRRISKATEARALDEDDEYQISIAAMARVARYTGAERAGTSEARILSLLPRPGQSLALHAALAAVIHHNADTHLTLL